MTLTFTATPTYPSKDQPLIKHWLEGMTNVIIDRTKGYSENMSIEPDDLYDMIDTFDAKYFRGMPPNVRHLANNDPDTSENVRTFSVFEYLLVSGPK